MRYTVELEGVVELFRLQKDRSWRDCSTNRQLEATDLVCQTAEEVLSHCVKLGEITIGGVTYLVDPEGRSLTDRCLDYTSSVFRQVFPKIPSREQLKEVIRLGNDSVSNCLILNVDGDFELLPSPPYQRLAVDPHCVLRHESFDAGRGYVGMETSEDDDFIDEHYLTSLECWVEHLKDGSTQEYSDIPPSKDIDTLMKELEEIRAAWKPQYYPLLGGV